MLSRIIINSDKLIFLQMFILNEFFCAGGMAAMVEMAGTVVTVATVATVTGIKMEATVEMGDA